MSELPKGEWLVPGAYTTGEGVLVDVVLPVYNEAHVLGASVARVRRFLQERADFRWRIIIADNASTDATLARAGELASRWIEVAVLHLPEKGRGRALRLAWADTQADIRTYMDIDLSTGLEAFPELVRAIRDDGYDIAVGTRLHRRAAVSRSTRREVLSQSYNMALKLALGAQFSDAQCGFKAIGASAAAKLLPLVEDGEWFFDTELLVLAERNGMRIRDVPVVWVEDPDTRVNVRRTAMQDLRGIARLRLRGVPRVAPG